MLAASLGFHSWPPECCVHGGPAVPQGTAAALTLRRAHGLSCELDGGGRGRAGRDRRAEEDRRRSGDRPYSLPRTTGAFGLAGGREKLHCCKRNAAPRNDNPGGMPWLQRLRATGRSCTLRSTMASASSPSTI